MYKKFVHIALVAVVIILGAQSSFATTSSGSGYNEPVVRSTFNFKAILANGKVSMSWMPYAPAGFNYYKVVRSTTNANPVYPDDGYIYYTGETNASSYVDTDPPAGKVYYRVCSIASPNRYCSPVVAVTVSDAAQAEIASEIESLAPATLSLSGKSVGGAVILNWTLKGSAPHGFKVCKSTVNEKPIYPIIKGDAYQHLTDPTVRYLKDSTVKAGQTYYYRVCQYNGNGACVSYSNPVSVSISSDGASASEDGLVTLAPADLSLSGTVGEATIDLRWSIGSSAPYGFKIAKSSIHPSPTYPVMEGDDYIYVGDPNARSYQDGSVDGGTTYYYRLCQYDGIGRCASYSDTFIVKAPAGWVQKSEKAAQEYEKSGEMEDVQVNQYKEAIQYLLNKNIVQGYADNTFKPNNTVNRAEFVKMILNSKYGEDSIGTKANCFRDVKVAWYSPYICLAKEKGIVSGYKDGTFKPSRTISFAEASKIVSELYGIDSKVGSNWYEGYVKALQAKKFIPQTVTAPDKNLTRGEVAELLWRVKENRTDQPSPEVSVSDGGESVAMATGEYAGWQTFEKNGYSFYYPLSWYRGLKSYGWDMLSEEKDYIDNLNVQNYMAVDTYVATYVASRNATGDSSLAVKAWFGHPLTGTKSLTVNGIPALRRTYRAPAGTVVNGRTTGENENIVMYTFRKDGKIIVLQYFNASGNESYGMDQFDKIAMSFR